ncbi:hypothetical protein R1sor_001781 [Riccia sorocarpa]|uniref:Protein kinase domain-containing protein n=1 Tax=Riccia sorocarpa TaxID=122646 RepID=A0ABD3GZL4_9MARC
MDTTTCIGEGRSRNVYLVGAVDPELAGHLGRYDVVVYVAKRLKDQWYEGSGFDELVKEFTTFPINHLIICSPSTGFFDRRKPTLIFPWWNRRHISDWIERELELRWKRNPNGQRREPVADDIIAKYDVDTLRSVEIFRKHRLHMAASLLQGLVFMHTHNWLYCDLHMTNIFVHFPLWDWDDMATLWGLFSDMTSKEKQAYDDEKFAMGYPPGTYLPHVAHGMRLRDTLERMTTADIANRHDYREAATYWSTYFQEQWMVDPLTCQRPPESKERAKKHPEGWREIGKDKL